MKNLLKIKQKRLSTSTPKNSYPQVDNKTPLRYDKDMTTEPSPQPEPEVSRALLKERIETKIEEYRECGLSTIDFDAGLIRGLELALQILEEE